MSLVTTHSTSFELQPGETLLEALERTGHEVAYQCRSGYCGACRVKLLSGRVAYASPPLAYVAADDILPCCCLVQEPIQIDSQLKPQPAGDYPDLFDEDC